MIVVDDKWTVILFFKNYSTLSVLEGKMRVAVLGPVNNYNLCFNKSLQPSVQVSTPLHEGVGFGGGGPSLVSSVYVGAQWTIKKNLCCSKSLHPVVRKCP